MDKKKKRQDILIKICCLALSFGVWLYINNFVNPVKSIGLDDVPVKIENTELLENQKLVLMPDQKNSVNIMIKGTASDVYSASASQFKITADLSNFAVKKGENNIPVKIINKPSNINILNSEALYVKIYIDDYEEQTLPVSVKVTGEPENGYFANKPEISDSKAVVSGAATYVATVKKVACEIDVKNADKDVSQYVSLKAYDDSNRLISGVNISPGKSYVTVPVAKAKTVGVNVKIKGQNQGDVIKSIAVSPDKIDISGDESVISKITSLDTEYVDVSSDNLNNVQAKLIVPEGVTLVNSNGYVNVKITIDKVINKTLTVNIKNKNLSDKYNAALDITSESIVISGPQSIIDKINADNIDCYIDFNSLTEGEYDIVVNITFPDGTTKVSVSSPKVHVKISMKP